MVICRVSLHGWAYFGGNCCCRPVGFPPSDGNQGRSLFGSQLDGRSLACCVPNTPISMSPGASSWRGCKTRSARSDCGCRELSFCRSPPETRFLPSLGGNDLNYSSRIDALSRRGVLTQRGRLSLGTKAGQGGRGRLWPMRHRAEPACLCITYVI